MGPENGIKMLIDATITVGNIIEICTIAGGGLIALVTVKNSVTSLRLEVHTIKDNIKEEILMMKTDFLDMKKEIKAVGDVIIKMAVTDQRLLNVEQDLRELKHGRGFVQHEIQGEWPRT